MTSRGMSLILLAAGLCAGQNPADLFSKAPPAVDTALRNRATQFYQAHVEGKFRIADQFVAEDSKDIFFEADKRRCRSFQIVRIDYDDSFNKASLVINCETDILLPPKGLVRVTMPLASKWKVDQGLWCWYVPQGNSRESAFGTMKPGPNSAGEESAGIPKGPGVEDLVKMVKADRNAVPVEVGSPATEMVQIKSTVPGTVRLELKALLTKDVKASLDKNELKQNETATLEITYSPSREHRRSTGATEDIRILVEPIRSTLLVRLNFR